MARESKLDLPAGRAATTVAVTFILFLFSRLGAGTAILTSPWAYYNGAGSRLFFIAAATVSRHLERYYYRVRSRENTKDRFLRLGPTLCSSSRLLSSLASRLRKSDSS